MIADDVFRGQPVLTGARVRLEPPRRTTASRSSGPRSSGAGYGTEATRLVVDYALDVAGLHRLHLQVLALNPRTTRPRWRSSPRTRGRPRLSQALPVRRPGDSDHDHGVTAMLEKVFYTSVLVSDQDRALDFYTNVLGLEKRVENPTPDGPRFLTVGVEGDEFQLVLWPGTPGQAEPAMVRPPASITIETDDCRKTFEELKSRDVEFLSDVIEFPWGYVAQFQDPDGNRLQIREGR